jgi:hypothetical protein
VTVYALVHNAATFLRDMELRITGHPSGPRPRVRVIGGAGKAARGEVILPAMAPGENRWLSFTITEASRRRAEGNLLTVEERVGIAVVNGFAIQPRELPDAEFAGETAAYHGAVCWRLAQAFEIDGPRESAETAFAVADDPKAYPQLLADAARQFPGWVKALVGDWDGGDPFLLVRQARRLGALDPGTPEAAAAHASLLHALDSFATMRLKAGGDLADILQTVEWLLRLLRREGLSGEENQGMIRACEHFASSYGSRQAGPEEYVQLVRDILDQLSRIAESVGVDGHLVENLHATLGEPTALQGAHRLLLLGMEEAIGAS